MFNGLYYCLVHFFPKSGYKLVCIIVPHRKLKRLAFRLWIPREYKIILTSALEIILDGMSDLAKSLTNIWVT